MGKVHCIFNYFGPKVTNLIEAQVPLTRTTYLAIPMAKEPHHFREMIISPRDQHHHCTGISVITNSLCQDGQPKLII